MSTLEAVKRDGLKGDAHVGKSMLSLRYTSGGFSDQIKSTIGLEYHSKKVRRGGVEYELKFWVRKNQPKVLLRQDTAGQEKFSNMTGTAALGAMVVFSVGDRNSFQNLSTWLNNLETKSTEPSLVTVVVGNKSDLEGTDRMVSRDEAERFCKQRSLHYMETSALNNDNVSETFEFVVDKILEALQQRETPTTTGRKSGSEPVVLKAGAAPTAESGGCCN